jgi:predicted transcriptional regulator
MTSQERQDKAEAARLAHVARLRMARTLKNEGRTNLEIAQLLGLSENSVRLVLVGTMADEEEK